MNKVPNSSLFIGQARHKDGKTALHLAAESGHLDIVKLLLDCGANVNSRGNFDRAALHLAAESGHLDIVKLLLDCGANVNSRGNFDRTALHLAAESGHLDVVQLLLERGADIDIRAKNGRTALYFAAKSGHLDITKLLLERGADINIRAKSGRTALHLAAESGHLDLIELLLKRGADASITTYRGVTARDFAPNEDIRRLFDKPPAVDWRNLKKETAKKPQTAPPEPPGKLKDSCLDRTARVVYYSGATIQQQEMTLYDLIYDDKLTEGKRTENRNQLDTKSANRWIHLPFNNVSTIPPRRRSQ